MASVIPSPIRIAAAFATLAISLGTFSALNAQSSAPATSIPSTSTVQAAPAATQPRRRLFRRHSRTTTQQSGPQANATATQVAPTPAQRTRDAQILATQQAQSAQTARENDAVTRKVVRDQQQQQAEPRIQDDPVPAPPSGNPVARPMQPADPQRIQDAPGPAQTQPQATPTPAPQP